MNEQYWLDLIFEGEKLTEYAEGAARDVSSDIPTSAAQVAEVRRDAESYRQSVNDRRPRYPRRREHQLQDVIDAYRWNHPDAAEAVPRGIGFERPGR